MECKDSFGDLLSKSLRKTFSSPSHASEAAREQIFLFSAEKKMRVEEGRFNRLPLDEQARMIWEEGTFVDSVIRSHYCLMLYSIHHRFAELFVDLRSHNIVWISLATELDLAKYLDHFQIEI